MQSRFYRPCVMMSCLETFQPLPPPAQSSKNYHVQINSPPHSTQHTPPQYSPFSSNTPQSPSAASPETKYHSPPPQQVSSSPAKAEPPPPNHVPPPSLSAGRARADAAMSKRSIALEIYNMESAS